jgi:hypothetical protein
VPLPDKDAVDATYGGPYANGRPVEDPKTEVDQGFLNALLASVASATHTVPRAWVTFNGKTYSGSGTDVVTVVDHDANWGSGTGVKPTVGQTGTNTFLITWPATVTDELGGSHTLNIRYPHEPTTIDTTLSRAKVTAKTANTLTIQTFNSAGSANGLNTIPIFVSWT